MSAVSPQTRQPILHDEATFRALVRAWLETNVPRRVVIDDELFAGEDEDEDEDDMVERVKRYQAALFDAGLAGITWPVEYGGGGLTIREQQIFNEEASEFDVPQRLVTIGLGMCAPTILAHGTEAQKRRYLPPLLRGDEIWCQLFSEPGAGSDLAAIQTRAVMDGNTWILDGQKVWSSVAHHASFGICLTRTDLDVPKHRGLTMFIVDMHTPGVTVRPLRQMTGATNFNEVFLDGVRLPAESMLGELNNGWVTAITTLMNERVAVGGGGPASSTARRVIRHAHELGVAGDPVLRQRLAELYIRETVQTYVGMRARAAAQQGRQPGPEGSIGKLAAAQFHKLAAQVVSEVRGAGIAACDSDDHAGQAWMAMTVSSPSLSIAGGTDEVQRNIIGERVLGLPREPEVDRDIPFREILRNGQETH